jgi:hypothetical protein
MYRLQNFTPMLPSPETITFKFTESWLYLDYLCPKCPYLTATIKRNWSFTIKFQLVRNIATSLNVLYLLAS